MTETKLYGGYTLGQWISHPWLEINTISARDAFIAAARRAEELEQYVVKLEEALQDADYIIAGPELPTVKISAEVAKEYDANFDGLKQLQEYEQQRDQRISDLERENAALREDKARLDWLDKDDYTQLNNYARDVESARRQGLRELPKGGIGIMLTPGSRYVEGETVRQAIDAARGVVFDGTTSDKF